MKIISFFTVKGGVGKTTTVANLAYFLAYHKKKVLMIDIDNQANLSKGLNMAVPRGNPDNRIFSYHLMTKPNLEVDLFKQAPQKVFPTLFLVPGGPDLLKVLHDFDMNKPATLSILRDNLRRFKAGVFDYCLVDCAAGGNILNYPALVASDAVIAPMKCDRDSLDGLVETIAFLDEFKSPGLNPALTLGGVLLTDYDAAPSEIAKTEEVRAHLGDICFKSVIRHTRTVPSAATLTRRFVHEYSPAGLGSLDYQRFTAEFLSRFPAA